VERADCETRPGELARQAQLVEPFGPIPPDARRQHGRLPGPGGDLESLQLLDHGEEALPPLQLAARRDVLPSQEETQQILCGDGLDLAPEPLGRVPVDPGEEPPLAELLDARPRGIEVPPQEEALRLEPGQGGGNRRLGEACSLRQLRNRARPEARQMSTDGVDPRLLVLGGEGDPRGHAHVGLDAGAQKQGAHARPLLGGQPETLSREHRGPPLSASSWNQAA
jgi:hypothetical protein